MTSKQPVEELIAELRADVKAAMEEADLYRRLFHQLVGAVTGENARTLDGLFRLAKDLKEESENYRP